MNTNFSLGQNIWYHKDGNLEGQRAKVVAKNSTLYRGTQSYTIRLIDAQEIIQNVKPMEIRERT